MTIGVDPAGCAAIPAVARRGGEPDGERRPTAGRALDVDRAAVQVDERLDDRQSEPGAGAAALVRRAAEEAIEEPARLLRRDALTGVGDGDRRLLRVAFEAQRDRAVLGRVEVRVRDEVRDDLTDPRRIGERGGARVEDLHVQPLALGLQPRLDQGRDLGQRLAQVDAAGMDLELARLDARDVEQVVDELDEPVGRLQRDPDELPLALGEVLGVRRLEQLDEALDRRQRAAQLVRCRRHEVALGLLEPRALGDVAQRPDDAAVGSREARGRDRERDIALTADEDLACERLVELRQRAVRAVRGSADAQRRDELVRARVQRRDAVVVVAHDEAVAEALDRRRQALTLGLQTRARVREIGAHRVEGEADGLQLLRSAGLDARAEVARRHPSRGADEVVERASHRADQQRQEGEHADEREARSEADRQQRGQRAGRDVIVGLAAAEHAGGSARRAARRARPQSVMRADRRESSIVGWSVSAIASRRAGAIGAASARLCPSSATCCATLPASLMKLFAARWTNVAVLRERGCARFACERDRRRHADLRHRPRASTPRLACPHSPDGRCRAPRSRPRR